MKRGDTCTDRADPRMQGQENKKKLAGKVAKKGKNCGREEAMFKTWK